MPNYLHDDLRPVLEQTSGVVVFHEQVIEMIAQLTGCTLAEADEARRALGDVEGMAQTKLWFFPRALGRGYPQRLVEEIWKVLEAFASFGFCKAHAAAFALPTYQSAWLKAHYPAHFLAGVLTHDPGMYPKRLILDDARQFGIAVLGLDVNASEKYVVEKVMCTTGPGGAGGQAPGEMPAEGLPGSRAYGIRLALSEVKGINEGEVERIIAARPYHSLTDFWHRAPISRPVAEARARRRVRLVGIAQRSVCAAAQVTRRDLLLRWPTSTGEPGRPRARAGVADRGCRPCPSGRSAARPIRFGGSASRGRQGRQGWHLLPKRAAGRPAATAATPATRGRGTRGVGESVRQSRRPGTAPVTSVSSPSTSVTPPRGGQQPARDERLRTRPRRARDPRARREPPRRGLLRPSSRDLGATRSRDLVRQRAGQALVGGEVATQTPPIRSGRRVVFLTLDDATGPVDATFFEDAQGPYAATVFHSWLLLVRGELRRTGPRGVSLRATGCWELPALYDLWQHDGVEAVRAAMAEVPLGFADAVAVGESAVTGAAESRATRPVMADPPAAQQQGSAGTAGGMGRRRVLVHSSGFKMSPYSDIKPAGEDSKTAPRKLWHRSPGSAG
jgi:error-prone DNA polymerase